MAKYKIIFSAGLDAMMLRHANFLSRVSLPAVKRFRTGFSDIVKRISKNPYQFPPYENQAFPSGAYRKALFAKWYQVVFCVDGDTVYLEAVVDGRQTDKV